MATFTDANGISHSIELDDDNLELIENRFGINLMDMTTGMELSELFTADPGLFFRIIGELSIPTIPPCETAQFFEDEEMMLAAVDILLAEIAARLPEAFRLLLIEELKADIARGTAATI